MAVVTDIANMDDPRRGFYAAVLHVDPDSQEVTDCMAETLLPELVPYMDDGWVRHPLIYDMTAGIMPGLTNARYRYKVSAIDDAVKEKRWHTYVWLHERPYRAKALADLDDEHGHDIPDDTYWELVADVWVDSENVWQNWEEWDFLFNHPDRPGRTDGLLKDEADRAFYDSLPDTEPVTVYRGATVDLNEDGLSWTTSRDKALWFGRRFDHKAEHGVVVTGIVPKDCIIAAFANRGESEIVVEEGSVEITKVEPVSPKETA